MFMGPNNAVFVSLLGSCPTVTASRVKINKMLLRKIYTQTGHRRGLIFEVSGPEQVHSFRIMRSRSASDGGRRHVFENAQTIKLVRPKLPRREIGTSCGDVYVQTSQSDDAQGGAPTAL